MPKSKPGQKSTWYSSDRPIQKAKEDLLGRTEFAQRLADDLANWRGEDSLVVALYGSWGSGKSSVKNLILESLAKRAMNRPLVMEFNPWQRSGTGNIPFAFFKELGLVLKASGPTKDIEKREKKLSAYAATLGVAGVALSFGGKALPFIGIPGGPVFEAIGEGLKNAGSVAKEGAEGLKAKSQSAEKSALELKVEVADLLKRLPQPVIVVIDDIDRLTTDEILQVFQLVKANADFPQLIYLLLFERQIITNALNRISGDRGTDFLEKIVQVGYHIPYATPRTIQKVLFAGLNAHLDEPAVLKRWDKHRWNDLFVDGISKYFQNLRHVYRFLASFFFHVRHYRRGRSFEVNPVDLIGLETLRLFEPAVYERLPSAKTIVTRDEGPTLLGGVKQQVVDEGLSQILAYASTGRRETVKNILHTLFPPLAGRFSAEDAISRHKHDWLRDLRVCHVDIFDKYFTLSIPESDLSQQELDRLLELSGDARGFVTACEALKKRGLSKVAFERLEAYKEHIPIENMVSLIQALCDLSDDLPKKDPGLFEQSLETYFSRLVYFGLRREADPQKRFLILKKAFSGCTGLALPVELVSLDERVGDRESKGHEFLIEESDLEELKKICIQKIRGASDTQAFRNSRLLVKHLWQWSAWASEAEVREWVTKYVNDPTDALWLLNHLVCESHSYGREHRLRRYINLREVEKFADVERLKTLTADFDATKLQGMDKIAIREFRKALRRRAEGKPDDAWRHERNDPDEEVL